MLLYKSLHMKKMFRGKIGKIGTDTIFQTGYKMEKWCLSLFCLFCVVLTILITLQDVSYALSPTSRFRPIADSEEQSNQPYPAPPPAETVFAPAPDVLKPQKEPDSDPRKLSGASIEESLRLFFKKIRDDFYRELAKISPEEIKTLRVCFPAAVLLSMMITQKYGLPLGRYEHTIDHQELLITGYKINDNGKISHQQHLILLLYLGGKAYYVDGTGADNGQFIHPDLEKVEIVFEKLESITKEAIYKELEEKHNLVELDPFLSIWREALNPESMGDYVAFLRSLQLLFDIGDYPQSLAPLSEAAHRIAAVYSPINNNQEEEKRLAAQGALDYLLGYIAAIKIKDRAVVIGLDSGTTMKHFIGCLGKALKERKLQNIIGIPTSKEIEKLAGENGIPLSNLEDNPVIDIYFGSADELNIRTLYSLKGGGGALTKEKEVMNKSKRVVIIVDSAKLVEHTASKSPLCIEIKSPGSNLQNEIIKGLRAIVPVNEAGYRRTQEGRHILGVNISYQNLHEYIRSLPEIEEKINKISGVIANGIFTRTPDVVIIGRKGEEARIIEVRKNKPRGNIRNLTEETNGIAIKQFTFIQMDENFTDEIKIDEKIIKIKQEMNGLFDQDKNIVFTGPFLYKVFTLAMLDTIFNNSDSFKGAVVVDLGAGDGVLSVAALGLGAKQVILVEKNKAELEKAKILLEARGWRKDTDFFIMPMDFAQVECIEKIKNFKPTVALINIGPWAEYGSSNQTAVFRANALPEVSLILNGGYHFLLTSDDRQGLEFSYMRDYLRAAGFTISDSYYPSSSIHILTATKVEKGNGSDLNTDLPNRTIIAKDISSGAEDNRDLKPFFKRHELGFQDIAAVTMAAKALKDLIIDKKAREGAIYKKIGELNKLFRDGEIEIGKKIKTGVFKRSGKEYKYAVFHFKEENKTINVLFLEGHAVLTPAELAELRIQNTEKRHLDYPGLEGVWFINSTAISKQASSAPPDTETRPRPRIGEVREHGLEREGAQKETNLSEDAKRNLENNKKTSIEARPAVIKEIAETRQATIVEMLNTLEEKDNDVKVVVGVPIDMNRANVQPALSAINRGLAKNGFGSIEDNKQVITFEIDVNDPVKTVQNQERAVQKAHEGLAPNGRVVLFAPQMERGPQLAGKAQEAYKDQGNITVVPDAYTDSAPEQNVFPDIMVRVALGRNIAFYYTGKDPQGTLVAINNLLAKVADGFAPIATVDDLLNILKPLRIRPADYNAITDWQRAQEAVATAL